MLEGNFVVLCDFFLKVSALQEFLLEFLGLPIQDSFLLLFLFFVRVR
jgi:hypothetical protein